MDVRWKDLHYNPMDPINKVRIPVLRGLTGHVQPGRALAILGPSGAGKTSLLSVLGGKIRKEAGLEGEVTYAGRPLYQVRSEVSVVEQQDLFLGALTVTEHLEFHARLRLHHLSWPDRRAKIDEVLASVGLLETKKKRIMVLSGGEKKRLSVAEELLNEPTVLLLDEPTSGLDSHMAAQVIQAIQVLAKASNKTVIFTIHQPSSELFNTFEDVMFVAKGRTAYWGPGSELVAHFQTMGRACPANYNPAEFLLSVLADKQATTEKQLEDLCDGSMHTTRKDELDIWSPKTVEGAAAATPAALPELQLRKRSRPPWIWEVVAISKRTLLQRTRQRLQTRLAYLNCFIISIFAGLIYWQLADDQSAIRNRTGAVFFLFVHPVFAAIFETAMPLVMDAPTLQREYKVKRLYRVSSYYLARTTGELAIQMSFPFLYATIVYWMVFADSFSAYIGLLVTLALACFTGASYGYMLSTFATDFEVSMSINIVFLVIIFLFSGMMMDVAALVPALAWVQYISLFKWAFDAAIILVWRGVTLTCDTAPGALCQHKTGEEVLRTYNISPEDADQVFATAMVMMTVLALVSRLIGFLRLSFRYKFDDDWRMVVACST